MLDIDGEESTSIGVYIKEIGPDGKILAEQNAGQALTPASVMKLVTTATALSEIGDSYRFQTKVYLTGTRSAQNKTVWNGNMVIESSADPTLESSSFKDNIGFCEKIAKALKAKNITRINGKIIVEESLSDAGPVSKWEIEDVAWPYGCGLFGLNYRDNTFLLYPATKVCKPEVPGLDVEVRKTKSGNDLVRGIESKHLVVYTTNPNNKKWCVQCSMPYPAEVLAYELKSKLAAAGITVSNSKSASKDGNTLLYTHLSPKSGDIMRNLMVHSDNLFAEGILRTLAPSASRKKAIEREKEIWNSRGINADYTIINDGSGLTRANRLSAEFIGNVLEWMATSEYAGTYTGFFPKAGKEGTLKSFLKDTPLEGRLILKTGSVSSVQAYAGYKIDDEGKPTHVVVIMVNGFFCPRKEVRLAIQNLLEEVFPDQVI